ncbi:MAG TPA: ankyrin repeat domain-containing protein [Anaerovoracaceae bacterium]|nr:ankyrin repeat domain-containing protein [Anaerovoracaceae bacterium]
MKFLENIIKKKDPAEFNWWLSNVSDVNALTPNGYTAFDCAIAYGQIEKIDALLDGGANPNISSLQNTMTDGTKKWALPFEMMCNRWHDISHKEKSLAEDVFVKLVRQISDMNGVLEDGANILHKALQYGVPDKVIDAILKLGADVNLSDRWKVSPLHYASSLRSVELLISHGADVNAQDNSGWTALHFAASRNDTEVARLLLEAGVDTTLKTTEGETAAEIFNPFCDDEVNDCAELINSYEERQRLEGSVASGQKMGRSQKL